MEVTKTLHPPGGATALIAVTSSAAIKKLGYWYLVSPVLSGALILLVVALLFNNLTKKRHYPNHGRYREFKKKDPPKFQQKQRNTLNPVDFVDYFIIQKQNIILPLHFRKRNCHGI